MGRSSEKKRSMTRRKEAIVTPTRPIPRSSPDLTPTTPARSGPDADDSDDAMDLVYDDTPFDVSGIDQVVPDHSTASESVIQDHDGLA